MYQLSVPDRQIYKPNIDLKWRGLNWNLSPVHQTPNTNVRSEILHVGYRELRRYCSFSTTKFINWASSIKFIHNNWAISNLLLYYSNFLYEDLGLSGYYCASFDKYSIMFRRLLVSSISGLISWTFLPLKWRQYEPSKQRILFSGPHDVTTKKT
jgi:hypothetical protein